METNLRQYFPMIREREAVLADIRESTALTEVFYGWKEGQREEFHEFPDIYYHYFYPKSDTGLKLELLQNYLFIPLDIFREIQHNNGIRNELEAWLTFLSADEPDAIVRLIEGWPEFKPMYVQLYVQDSLASLGAGFGSAFADIIHIRIPALYTSFRSAQSQRPPDVVRPRGAYIRWEIELPLIQTCCSPPVEVGVISHLIYV